MGVKPTASDLVTTRLGDYRLSKSGEQGADDHDGTPKGCTLSHEVVRLDVSEIDPIGAESVGALVEPFYIYTHLLQQPYQVVDIQDVGNIFNYDLFTGEQCGADHL